MYQISCHPWTSKVGRLHTELPKVQKSTIRLLTVQELSATSSTSRFSPTAAPRKTDDLRVIGRHISLETYDTISNTRLARICNVYGWTEEEGARVAANAASILDTTVVQHEAWIQQVAILLGVTQPELGRILFKYLGRETIRYPEILSLSPHSIAAKLLSLRIAFDGSAVSTTELVTRFPWILALNLERAHSIVETAASDLHSFLSYDPRQIFIFEPSLMTDTNLVRKIHALLRACQTDPEWMEQLQHIEPAWLGHFLWPSTCEKKFARLRFYKSCPREPIALEAILIMPEEEFSTAHPDFEKWWLKDD